jgi:hypothetical protein
MHISPWIALILATTTLAESTAVGDSVYVYGRDIQESQDTPTLRKAFAAITAAVIAFDGSLKQITPDNVATSIKDLNTKGHGLADTLSSAAKSISSSPPLKGIQDAIGLLTPGRAIGNALNSTYQNFLSKADIIKNSKQTALIVDMLNAQKQPLIDFEKAFLTQIPASMASSIPKDLIPPDEVLIALFDGGVQQVANIMDGKPTSSALPGGLFGGTVPVGFPSGGLPGVPAAQASSAAPAASVPVAATPKASPLTASAPNASYPKTLPEKNGAPGKGPMVLKEFEA